ncbi:hypothetical protein OIU74_023186 [Salix koriyanagi]|uniref:Uncharacterized protein n=1 Tax=Salix koriyanagi TaxID=2511006 RepID=A0A9Q0WEE1_9ROSI|nr:hypothetical protein OIU74_023186 [Salix koriyanagi]
MSRVVIIFNFQIIYFVPDISDANHCGQTAQISVSPLSPALWASTDTFSVSDLTPTSEISTITDGPGSVENYGLGKLCGSKIGPVEGLEADVGVKLLKEARIEVSNSDARSKKVQDAMTKAAMDEYSTLPEEKDWMIPCFHERAHSVFVFLDLELCGVHDVLVWFGIG